MAHAWKACWVQALGGSNPPSSATGPRDRFRFRGFCCLWRRWCCLWCRWCSGRRRARPPARSPHASFARSGRSRSPPVPSGPSGALHTGGAVLLCVAERVVSKPGQAPPPPTGTAARRCSPRRQASGFCGGRQSGGPALLSPGLVPLKLRGLRRSLHPGARPGPRPSQRASSGAGPSRCSSIRPRTPSR